MLIKLTIFFIFSIVYPAYAYIDPATGNAFFTLAITIVSAFLFGIEYIYEHFFLFKGLFLRNKKSIPLLLYSEGNTYWPWFELLLDELEKRQINTQFYTSSPDDMCFSKNYQYIHPTFIGKGNKAYAKMAFVKADIVLMTTPGLDVYQLKRSKYVKKYVHFYHGLGSGCIYKLFGVDYYDTLFVDNEINCKYIRELEQKRNLPQKELVIVGNILLDKLRKRVKNIKNSKNNEKTILLSPSWGRESVLYKCGETLIDELLKTPFNIIIRPHPQMKIDNPELLKYLQKKYPEDPKLHWDFNVDNLPSMAKSSLMISDFSGIIFEYAFTFKKPVITFNKNLNLEQYDASDVSSELWVFTILNKIGRQLDVKQINKISEIIITLINSFNENSEKLLIDDVINKYWKYKGKCVKNIVDYLQKQLNDNEK